MTPRRFVDAPNETRCKWDRVLRDGSGAQCGRRRAVGDYCTQHARIANARPVVTPPAWVWHCAGCRQRGALAVLADEAPAKTLARVTDAHTLTAPWCARGTRRLTYAKVEA